MFEDIDWKEVAMQEICQQSMTSLVERVHDSLVEIQESRRFRRLGKEELVPLIRIMSEIQNRLRKMEEISRRGTISTEPAPQTPKQDDEDDDEEA